MQKLSAIYPIKPLQRVPAVPLPSLGNVLSIHNNDFHPVLKSPQIEIFDSSIALLQAYLPPLVHAGNELKNLPIRTNEWFLGINYLNSYIYILDQTLQIPENRLLNIYARAKKVGAK